MPLNSEEINFENKMTSCFLGIIIRSHLFALLTKRGVKMAKEELGLYPAILTVRLVNKIFLIQQKDFPLMRIRNNFLFRRPGKKASCVCTTINPRRSFTLFFFHCLLPPLATSLLTLSKSCELCNSAPRTFSLARDQSGQSRASKMSLSCLLG